MENNKNDESTEDMINSEDSVMSDYDEIRLEYSSEKKDFWII